MSLFKWVPFNSTKYRTGTPHVRATLIIPNDVFLNSELSLSGPL